MKNISKFLSLVSLLVIGTVITTGCGSSDSAKNASTKKSNTKAASTKTAEARYLPAPLPEGPPLKEHDKPIPILMYHVVTTAPATASFPDLFVPKESFAAHMKALANDGFHAVTLEQVNSYWRKGTRLPEKPIVISFDDGYHSIYSNAFPVMRKLRWPGVLNLKVDNLKVAGGINARNVRTLLKYGWELGAHTITHPDLTKVDADTLNHEIAGSRKILRKRFGVEVNTFCYPAGRFDNTVINAVESAGYTSATTTVLGYAKPGKPFELSRVRVNGSDSADALLERLHGLAT
jgi:peptidoglycan/xylan/chitin deacetylase (PgdA/CDA1 family)